MFKINTEGELLQLLKVISEEAVKKSQKVLNETVDSAQERYMSTLKASETNYGVKLSEQETEEPAEDSEEKASKEDPVSTEDEEVEEIDPETLGVSFDSVIKDINTLRSGRSTKDKEIKDELLGYYDRLDEDERKILHLFLSEISKILQGALKAADAQDPSDEPFNAEVTFGEEETPSEEQGQKQAQKPQKNPKSEREDNAPPISVGQKGQSMNEIRVKVKRLMKRF